VALSQKAEAVVVQTYLSLADVPSGFGPSAVTIGKFDGVHAGHRAVIGELMEISLARQLVSVVVTFDRNPLRLLHPERCPPDLVSLAQKLELLTDTGIDSAVVLTFDHALSDLPAEQFVLHILVETLKARVVLVGADFRFGANGIGTVETLRALGATHGFEVVVVDDVAPDGGRRVSSTWVRELIADGRVAEAARLLGGLPTVRGTVVHGLKRGRQLGYPTANLSKEHEGYLPADGVYAAWLTVDGTRHPAAVSIGNNPTFGDVDGRQVEAHVIDETLDLYDRTIELSFVEHIRGMRKFSGADALADQMGRDEDSIRRVLGVPEAPGT
jgi:riboflavin kinase/FMN adenylyltransferase